MQNHTGLAGMVEVQPVAAHNIEEIIRCEGTIEWRLQVISRGIAFLLSAGCGERAGFRMVGTIGQVLQRQKWMCGAPLT